MNNVFCVNKTSFQAQSKYGVVSYVSSQYYIGIRSLYIATYQSPTQPIVGSKHVTGFEKTWHPRTIINI